MTLNVLSLSHSMWLFMLQCYFTFSCSSLSLLRLRQRDWSGERRVCHCHRPGQSGSQGRFSHSWRQTDRCESLSASMKSSFYFISFHTPFFSIHHTAAHMGSFGFLIHALFHSSIRTPNPPDKVGFG